MSRIANVATIPSPKTNSDLALTLFEPTGDGVNQSEEVKSQLLDSGSLDSDWAGPIDPPSGDRPNLHHGGRGSRKKLPPLNRLTHGGGTHDVNDEMIAKEYRRGLRVTGLRCSLREELGFILDDI